MKKEKMTVEEGVVILDKYSSKAEEVLSDKEKTLNILDKALQMIKENKDNLLQKFGNVLDDFDLMISLVKSYVKKEYREVPLRTILLVLGSIIYFITPIDIIPDITPIVGYADDAFIIGLCLKSVDRDLKEYKKWKDENNK